MAKVVECEMFFRFQDCFFRFLWLLIRFPYIFVRNEPMNRSNMQKNPIHLAESRFIADILRQHLVNKSMLCLVRKFADSQFPIRCRIYCQTDKKTCSFWCWLAPHKFPFVYMCHTNCYMCISPIYLGL